MCFVFRVVFFLKENVLLLTTSPRPVSCCFVFTARELSSRPVNSVHGAPRPGGRFVFTSVCLLRSIIIFRGRSFLVKTPKNHPFMTVFRVPPATYYDRINGHDGMIFHVFPSFFMFFSHFSIPPHPPCNDEILIFYIFLDKRYLSFLFFWTKHHHCMGGVGGSDFCIEKNNFRKNDQNCEN